MSITMTPEHSSYIATHYAAQGPTQIAQHLGLCRYQIAAWAHRHGIRVSPESLALIKSRAHAKTNADYLINPDQFLTVVSADVAYLLGLLWADGYVKSIGHSGTVTLNNRADDMEEIKPLLARIGHWHFYHISKRRPSWRDQIMVRTSGAVLYHFLSAHDYRSKSASPNKILSHIPDHLKHYWWRGYMDGDGKIYIGKHCHQITFASTHEQDWSFAVDLCTRLGIRFTVAQSVAVKGHKSSAFRVCGIENCKTLGAYLYQGYDIDGIGLKRKHVKYVELTAMKARTIAPRYEGVTLCRQTNRWGARIIANKTNGLPKNIPLGHFLTPEEANAARLSYIAQHNIPRYERKQRKIYNQSHKGA